MADKDISVAEFFETISTHKSNALEYEVKLAMAEVSHEFANRGMTRSSEHIFVLERTVTTLIIDSYKSAVFELFEFVNSEYISVITSDLDSIKALVNKHIKESAAKISIDPQKYLGEGSNVHTKKLEALKTGGANEYLLSFIDMKFAQAQLNKGSVVLSQAKWNRTFGILTLIISFFALLASGLVAIFK